MFVGWYRKVCGICFIFVWSFCDVGCKFGYCIKYDVYIVFVRVGIWYNKRISDEVYEERVI